MSSQDYGGSSLTSLPALSVCVPFTLCTGTSVSFQKQSSFHIISLLKVLHNMSRVYRIKPKFMSMVFKNLQVSTFVITHAGQQLPPHFLTYPSRLSLKSTFVTNLFLILLLRNSQSFLCIPTVLVWVYLFHAVLFSDLTKCLSSCPDSRLIWPGPGLYAHQHPREHPSLIPHSRPRRDSVNTFASIWLQLTSWATLKTKNKNKTTKCLCPSKQLERAFELVGWFHDLVVPKKLGKNYRKKRCLGIKSMNNTLKVEKQIQDTLPTLFATNTSTNI